jgi:hypothetical protein
MSSTRHGLIIDDLTIERAYELVTGASTANARRSGRHVTVRCPDRTHDDARASCDLDVEKNVWCCRTHPGGRKGGGRLDLPIIAGLARNRAEAARWLEKRIRRR